MATDLTSSGQHCREGKEGRTYVTLLLRQSNIHIYYKIYIYLEVKPSNNLNVCAKFFQFKGQLLKKRIYTYIHTYIKTYTAHIYIELILFINEYIYTYSIPVFAKLLPGDPRTVHVCAPDIE